MKNYLSKAAFLLAVLLNMPTVHAMAGVRNLAKEALSSNTVTVVAGLLGAGASLTACNFYQGLQECKTSQDTPLLPRARKDVQDCFVSSGVHDSLEIKVGDGLGVVKGFTGKSYVLIPQEEAKALSGRLSKFTKKEVMAVLSHEAEHLKHYEALILESCRSLVIPTAVILGKMARVAGRGRAFSAVVGTATAVAGELLVQKHSRDAEYRCDDAIAPEHALSAASYLRKADIQEFLKNKIGDQTGSHSIFDFFDVTELVSSHPSTAKRIKRLEERARVAKSLKNATE